jgi:hypothetical protein
VLFLSTERVESIGGSLPGCTAGTRTGELVIASEAYASKLNMGVMSEGR